MENTWDKECLEGTNEGHFPLQLKKSICLHEEDAVICTMWWANGSLEGWSGLPEATVLRGRAGCEPKEPSFLSPKPLPNASLQPSRLQSSPQILPIEWDSWRRPPSIYTERLFFQQHGKEKRPGSQGREMKQAHHLFKQRDDYLRQWSGNPANSSQANADCLGGKPS